MSYQIGGAPTPPSPGYSDAQQALIKEYARDIMDMLDSTESIAHIKSYLEQADNENLNLHDVLSEVITLLKNTPKEGLKACLKAISKINEASNILSEFDLRLQSYSNRATEVFEKL